jgi:hypothetical protein
VLRHAVGETREHRGAVVCSDEVLVVGAGPEVANFGGDTTDFPKTAKKR